MAVAQQESYPAPSLAALYCPECGQPLRMQHSQHAYHRPSALAGRSLFLIVVGLFLATTFGVNAWRATRTVQNMIVCTGTGSAQVCRPLPHDLAQALASGR